VEIVGNYSLLNDKARSTALVAVFEDGAHDECTASLYRHELKLSEQFDVSTSVNCKHIVLVAYVMSLKRINR